MRAEISTGNGEWERGDFGTNEILMQMMCEERIKGIFARR